MPVGAVTVMRGAAVTMKGSALKLLPARLLTLIGPVVAAKGTTAVICAGLTTVTLVARTSLKATLVVLVKLMPVRVTSVPAGPEAGVKLLRVGPTVNQAALTALPAGVVTPIRPLRAPAGTMSLICASLSTVKTASAWTSSTTVAPLKPLPLRVTTVPTGPAMGRTPLIVGGGMTSAP